MANKSDENEEKTYEVKDKRRLNPDGTLKEEAAGEEPAAQPEEQATEPAQEAEAGAAEAPAEEAPSEAAGEPAAEPQGEQQQMPPPNAYDMLGFCLGLLADTAWQLMGIRLAPGQKEAAKDLAQAKVAIDTIVFIADRLHPVVGEDERRALRGLISDLQINFVQQS